MSLLLKACVDVCVLFRWRYFLREACTITWVAGVLPVLARARAADRLSEPGRLGEEAAGDQVTRHHKSSTAIIKYNIKAYVLDFKSGLHSLKILFEIEINFISFKTCVLSFSTFTFALTGA